MRGHTTLAPLEGYRPLLDRSAPPPPLIPPRGRADRHSDWSAPLDSYAAIQLATICMASRILGTRHLRGQPTRAPEERSRPLIDWSASPHDTRTALTATIHRASLGSWGPPIDRAPGTHVQGRSRPLLAWPAPQGTTDTYPPRASCHAVARLQHLVAHRALRNIRREEPADYSQAGTRENPHFRPKTGHGFTNSTPTRSHYHLWRHSMHGGHGTGLVMQLTAKLLLPIPTPRFSWGGKKLAILPI